MKLIELIKAVREEKLTREQLEAYQDQMSYLFADLQLEMAELEKEEAQFMGTWAENNEGVEASVAYKKVMWKSTKSGQRLIELKRYALATKEMINSLKSRIYKLIY